MLSITKFFTALMAATAVVAAPNKRQTDFTTCEFLMAPDAAPGSINLDTEFNFVIGRTLAQQVPNTSVPGSNLLITDNGNNTFTVVRTAAIDGKTAAQTASILVSLIGTTKNGFAKQCRPRLDFCVCLLRRLRTMTEHHRIWEGDKYEA